MTPTIGMIVPPEGDDVPPEAPALYPQGVRFIARGLGLKRLTPEGYDSVIDDVGRLAAELAADGADAVALMGTSLSFYRGAESNEALIETMREATGLPVTTMSTSIVEALRTVGGRRIALGTAYIGSVNDRLRRFLEEAGFSVTGLASLDIADVKDVFNVTSADLLDLADRALDEGPGADALFLSCGGLRTLDITVPVEEKSGLPVVSSSVAGVWGAVRLLDRDLPVGGQGRLFDQLAA